MNFGKKTMSDNGYTPVPRSQMHRLKNRGTYDYGTIHSIISSAPMVHVSFLPDPDEDPFPTILPMLCSVGSFSDPSAPLSSGPKDLYIHGHVSGRIMRLALEAASSFSSPYPPPEDEEAAPRGLPVCIAASHCDGIVLSLTPFHNSMNYRSAVVHGHATLVTDPAEKFWAMELITDELVPHRWANSRTPPTNAEMQSTSILRVRVASASAKVRVGGPSEDRKDEKDERVRGKFWTGVVPASLHFGEPVAAEGNRVEELPPQLKEWIREHNERGVRYARDAVDMSTKAKN